MHKSALNNIEHTARCHKLEFIARVNLSLFEPYIYNYALVAVVVAVKNQCTQRSVDVACRSRNIMNNLFKNCVNVDSCLCGNFRSILGRNTDYIFDFLNNPVGSALGKSILLTTGTISSPLSTARYVFARVCASMPCDASTTRIAPSQAANERETS